jgi:transposase
VQQLLLSAKHILSLDKINKFKIIFSCLSLPPGLLPSKYRRGRPGFSRQSILRTLIYKALRGLPTLSDLVATLNNNCHMAEICGFDITQPLPSIERFSSFLQDSDNELLQQIKRHQVKQLIQHKVISGNYLSIDSTPIPANVKENNLKTNIRHQRFDKTKFPEGDPDARLGVIITYPSSKPKTTYFWGYKNHAVCDTGSELPLAEVTKPADVHDSNLFIPLFSQVKNNFALPKKGALGDAAYDAEYIFKFVIKDLKVNPFIARNRRNKHQYFTVSSSGARVCIAGFEMLYWGKFKDRGKIRLKFVCPIKHSKKFASKNLVCPMSHPNFFKKKGCTSYLRGDEEVRRSIKYGSQSFKNIFKKRTASERVFSRLLTACLQNPTVFGLQAIANHCTLAHIAVLSVALAASSIKDLDQIRSIKSFLT